MNTTSDTGGEPRHRGIREAEFTLSFEAFYLSHADPYYQYALSRLGDETTSMVCVDEAFGFFLDNWGEVMRQANVESYCWDVLRSAVSHRLSAAQAKAAFARAMLRCRAYFEIRDSDLGLYQAIAELPPKQFDVVVLKYVAHRSTAEIAWLLGLSGRTVDYHLRMAKDRLSRDLRLPGAPGRKPDHQGGNESAPRP